VATASKVLNGRPGVSQETRERVRAAMQELGYYPSTSRSDEPGQAVTRITVVVPDLGDSGYTAQMLQALLESAADHDIQIITRLLQPMARASTAKMNEWARSFLGGGSQGAIFVVCQLLNQAQLEACERFGLPMLAVDCHLMLDAGITSITANNFAGGYAAAQHLLSLGHRRIGLVIGLQTSATARERSYGFRAALRQAGIRIPEELVHEGDFKVDTGLAAGRKFLSLSDPPTAIAANCDGCALGVMDAARERGLQLPEDLSIIGFDDIREAQWSFPKLTTVNQPLKEIADLAITTMLRMVNGKYPVSRHVQLATELVVRDSTAPPRRTTASAS
jgi:LacI family transcriptional regulator